MTEQGRVRDDVMGLDREIFALGAVVALGTIMTVLDLTVSTSRSRRLAAASPRRFRPLRSASCRVSAPG